MKYGLGVDLGTSFTGVASSRHGHTEMTNLGNRTMVTPSVVFSTRENRLLTGEVAARRALEEPGRSMRDFKRRLGDPTPLIIGTSPYSPVKLMAALLRDVVAEAVRVHGEPPERVVLSHPAVWGPYRREQFDEVPRLAGIENIRMITEPVAAATHYTATQELADGDIVAVYDLGGGTFDAAVLQWEHGEMQILGDAEGVEWLGGSDFDEAIVNFVDKQLDGRVFALDPRNEDEALSLSRLRQECVLAKEALSFDEETTIPVFIPNTHSSIRLTRTAFEQMVQPAVNSTVDALHRALASAKVRPDELKAVLLVGGSSRIPVVARTVEAALDRPTVVNAHPKHAVALGAARIAAGLLEPPVPVPVSERGRRNGRTPGQPGAAIPARPPAAPTRTRSRRLLRMFLVALLVVAGAAVIGAYYGYTHRTDGLRAPHLSSTDRAFSPETAPTRPR